MKDQRIVMTLDAGGTNLKFSAIQNDQMLFEPVYVPTDAINLDRCLESIASGFEAVRARLPAPPVAISFAFPGPADYPNGIIGDLPNLPAFRGGVALGPFLEERFQLPVFINNDGDLFVYGEALSGFLPQVNQQLEIAGSSRNYKNLFGVTLGTGFGGGIVRNGELFIGDNSIAGEAWLLRNKLDSALNAEEGCCIRAVRRTYAELTETPLDDVPEPKELCAIAQGEQPGDSGAAREAFRRLGEATGDALAQALTLIDGLAVIGGGLSGAAPLFMPALVAAMNDVYSKPDGPQRKLVQQVYNFEDEQERTQFLQNRSRSIPVPGSDRHVVYDPEPRLAVGLSRLGTSHAVAVGAYQYAIQLLHKEERV